MQTIPLELLATLLDDLPVGLVIAEVPSGKPTHVNRALRRILGIDTGSSLEDASVVHRAFTRAGAPYPADRMPFARALATGGRVEVDDLVVHRDDGEHVYVRAVATPATDPAAGTEHVIIVFHDITEQVRAQEARKSLEQQLAFAVNHAPILLWMHDRDGTITLSEGAALAGLGFKPGQLVGQSVFDLYRGDPTVLQNIHRALAGESITSRYEVSSGFTLQSSREPVFGPGGEVTGVIGVATDISETRRLEEQLFRTQKLEAMGTLASGIAHEFNNVLAAIFANSELCQQSLPLGHEARARVDDIAAASQRARDLVQHLLTYSRPQAPRRILFELRPIVEEAARFLRATLPISLQLDFHFDPALDGRTGSILGDPNQIHQVLANLVFNAAHALGHQGQIEIRLREAVSEVPFATVDGAMAPGRYLALSVADGGHGIDPSVLGRIFDPFFTTKQPGQGTGLGLAVVHGIVRSHRGGITVASTPGGGAVFTVLLPPARDGLPSPAGPVGEPPRGRGERILVLDDNFAVAKVTAGTLCQLGYDTSFVTSIEDFEAELLRADRPHDLFFVDQTMRRMTGVELMERLRKANTRTPVVIASFYDSTATKEAVYRLGHAAFLQKPFDPGVLAVLVRRLIDAAD